MIFFLRNKTNTFARLNSNKNIGHDRIQLKKFDQMMQSINIRCMQHFLYFESHTKSLNCYTLLFVSVHFLSVLHLQYQHILLTGVCT